MTTHACMCANTLLDRPGVTDLMDGPTGRSFTVLLQPGQEIPTHQNVSRVVLTAVRGTGAITIGCSDTRALREGAFVQLEPNASHAVVAGAEGLELLVALAPNCCRAC